MSADEFAQALHCEIDAGRRWQRLGLLLGEGDQFPDDDLERGRPILHAARQGVTAEEIATASTNQGDLLAQFSTLASGGSTRLARPIETAIDAIAIDPATLGRVWVAAGLGGQTELYDEDLEPLRAASTALAAGVPEDALVQLLRVYADALGRVGDAEQRLFHYYVHERLRSDGLAGLALTEATDAVVDQVIGLIEPMVTYFHRKAFQRAARDDFIVRVREATTPPTSAAGESEATIMFVDLAGFTPLTESMGDVAAAEVIDRFSVLLRGAATLHHGRVVKQIGDEFMMAFVDPSRAVAFALALEDLLANEPQFPGLRIGAHFGTVLYREGDYLGTTVNLAARVTAAAERHQTLITRTLLEAAELPPGASVAARGPRALKGIADEVELFAVERTDRAEQSVDPVCQMVLSAEADTIDVMWNDVVVRFCSPACAAQFRSNPVRYARSVPTA